MQASSEPNTPRSIGKRGEDFVQGFLPDYYKNVSSKTCNYYGFKHLNLSQPPGVNCDFLRIDKNGSGYFLDRFEVKTSICSADKIKLFVNPNGMWRNVLADKVVFINLGGDGKDTSNGRAYFFDAHFLRDFVKRNLFAYPISGGYSKTEDYETFVEEISEFVSFDLQKQNAIKEIASKVFKCIKDDKGLNLNNLFLDLSSQLQNFDYETKRNIFNKMGSLYPRYMFIDIPFEDILTFKNSFGGINGKNFFLTEYLPFASKSKHEKERLGKLIERNGGFGFGSLSLKFLTSLIQTDGKLSGISNFYEEDHNSKLLSRLVEMTSKKFKQENNEPRRFAGEVELEKALAKNVDCNIVDEVVLISALNNCSQKALLEDLVLHLVDLGRIDILTKVLEEPDNCKRPHFLKELANDLELF